MWPFKSKKDKAKFTYAEEHNKAYSAYKKASQIGIWAGVLNVVGLLIAILQVNFEDQIFNLFFCFGSEHLLLKGILKTSFIQSNIPLFYVIAFASALLISAYFILTSVFAKQGKRVALMMMFIGYCVDTLMLIPLGISRLETLANLWLTGAIHAVIFLCMALAIYEYYKIIKIAITHKVLEEVKEGEITNE